MNEDEKTFEFNVSLHCDETHSQTCSTALTCVNVFLLSERRDFNGHMLSLLLSLSTLNTHGLFI